GCFGPPALRRAVSGRIRRRRAPAAGRAADPVPEQDGGAAAGALDGAERPRMGERRRNGGSREAARAHPRVCEGGRHLLHDVPPASSRAILRSGVHDIALPSVRCRGGHGSAASPYGLQELGVTSPDGKFTVIEVECLGACGFATPVMVNEEFIESVTPEGVPGLLARFK